MDSGWSIQNVEGESDGGFGSTIMHAPLFQNSSPLFFLSLSFFFLFFLFIYCFFLLEEETFLLSLLASS